MIAKDNYDESKQRKKKKIKKFPQQSRKEWKLHNKQMTNTVRVTQTEWKRTTEAAVCRHVGI